MTKFLWFPLAGSVSGFFSGLLGIGGGVIMVPFLIFIFPKLGFDQRVYVHSSLATSSACAFFFTLSGTLAHARFKNVKWNNVPYLGTGAFLGAMLGSTVASHTPGEFIKRFFALFMFYVAYRLFFKTEISFKGRVATISRKFFFFLGLITGSVASFFGIGGGVIAVPVMAFMGFDMREAVGTSSAMIPFTTFSSALGYIINGWNNPFLPKYSLGFVFLPAVVLIVPFGVIMAQIGASIATKAPQIVLRRIFACLLVVVAIKIFFNL